MSHWQLRLQRKFLYKTNGFLEAFFISLVIHVLIFLVPFLFIKHSGIIIIDSNGKYNLPVYYKIGSGSGAGLSGFSRNKNLNNKHSKGLVNSKVSQRKTEDLKELRKDTNSFFKFKKLRSKDNRFNKNLKTKSKLSRNKKDRFKEKSKKSQKNDSKKTEDQKILKEDNLQEKETSKPFENAPEAKPEVLNSKTEEINFSEPLIISGEDLGNISGETTGAFGIEGYLHTDGQLVNDIRSAVSRKWSRPKGFSVDTYCEFKILVSSDGKSVKILEQKNSKIPAFNIQARGAILKTEFPEKCWNKELNLILR